ncbi:MAG: zinc-ribbon domain containing protein [Dehalococcoidia bacterium]
MSFVDRELQCIDCGATFTFSANEQEFFAGKGFENDPKRCPDCRAAKKRERRGDSFGSRRQMYPAVCANCGVETEVPFEPRQGRPVYCSQCYQSMGAGSRR